VMTEVPGQKPSLNAKGEAAIAARLHALGMELADVQTVPHRVAPLAEAITQVEGDMVLILTGSATSDARDTAPEAIRAASGEVTRFGMPVDPGNLLVLGRLPERPVIGLPGCARSPALNGADWVLERLACGLAVSDDDIAAMGVGGLLKEIPIRPQPREP
ncbi:MAG: molybdopterin-binding protein, partial [Planctomycetota bacterium]